MQAAALNPRRDPANLIPNAQSRPGDVFIPVWSLKKPCCLDITVVVPKRSTPLPPALYNTTNYRPWFSADDAEQSKLAKHFDKCREMGILFEPLVFEAGGFIHERTLRMLQEIADQRAHREE